MNVTELLEATGWVSELPTEQRDGLVRLWRRYEDRMEAEDFVSRLSAPTGIFKPYIGFVDNRNMFIGIEPDGYTHT